MAARPRRPDTHTYTHTRRIHGALETIPLTFMHRRRPLVDEGALLAAYRRRGLSGVHYE